MENFLIVAVVFIIPALIVLGMAEYEWRQAGKSSPLEIIEKE